ncbi:DUF4139 domain-containing protein [Croceicoccus pelagius]|uniref:DUF4139 domain-containing protein n=1 Tax=Croceicoccus pelagius TaxID=1703341 RepID=UPI000A71C386|nr:hypothetical protein [Croceicoccus pelagius]
MRHVPLILAASALALPAQAEARTVVEASAPESLAVTVYRDPDRDRPMRLNWLNGFALISETRTVTLPPGESRIRFDGVAESMVAVSAIVTGLPGGTIEKNRNADILSPAALVNGTLGNRVTITRTNPATGAETSERAIVHTRADGGLVLQTDAGYEAVRCAGIPERLTFDEVPNGLSPNPVYSVDTRSESGGTYTVTLNYLASGFDWSAHYVATFAKAGQERERRLKLTAWLTLANGNGQSFPDAELMAVAGKLEIRSDYRDLGTPPRGEPLRLTCFPIGSTSTGTNYPPPPPPPPPPPSPVTMSDAIVVTGSRVMAQEMAFAPAAVMKATEEALGDLKLYRVPMPVTVAANAQKQVAFLTLDAVEGKLIHRASCMPHMPGNEMVADVVLRSTNEDEFGLGRALPAGGVTVFEPSAYGPLLIAEDKMEDRAVGQEVEIAIAPSSQVKVACEAGRGFVLGETDVHDGKWHELAASITNDSTETVEAEIAIGNPAQWEVRKPSRKTAMQNGLRVIRVTVQAGETRELRWQVRNPAQAKAR